MLLDHVTNVAQPGARLHQFNTFIQTLLGDLDQAFAAGLGLADDEHLAGITVPSVFDYRDVDIDDVTVLQHLFLVRDAVADHMIH